MGISRHSFAITAYRQHAAQARGFLRQPIRQLHLTRHGGANRPARRRAPSREKGTAATITAAAAASAGVNTTIAAATTATVAMIAIAATSAATATATAAAAAAAAATTIAVAAATDILEHEARLTRLDGLEHMHAHRGAAHLRSGDETVM